MANVLIDENTLQDIANKTRELSGSEEPMTMSEANESLGNTKQSLDTTLEEIKTSIIDMKTVPFSKIQEYCADVYENGFVRVSYNSPMNMYGVFIDKNTDVRVNFINDEKNTRIMVFVNNLQIQTTEISFGKSFNCIYQDNLTCINIGNVFLKVKWNEDDTFEYDRIKLATTNDIYNALYPSSGLFSIVENKMELNIDKIPEKQDYVRYYRSADANGDVSVIFKVGDDESDIVQIHKEDQILRVFKSDSKLVIVGDVYIYAKDLTVNPSKTVVKKLWEEDIDAKPGEIVKDEEGNVLGEKFNYASEASGLYSHAEGYETTASKEYSHAEGVETEASGVGSHAEGVGTIASGEYSHAEGGSTIASGEHSHAEGGSTIASGDYSHAEGYDTKASSYNQHVQGKYNIEDTENKYAHIVGNGTDILNRSNAYTLDWDGNAKYAGDVVAYCKDNNDMELASEGKERSIIGNKRVSLGELNLRMETMEKLLPGGGVIIDSSTPHSTKKFKLTVDDSGNITATEVTDDEGFGSLE